MTFFTEFLRNPRQNASIVPSAPAACEKMFEGLDMASMKYVVELGPTMWMLHAKELMAQLPASAEVLMLEINHSTFDVPNWKRSRGGHRRAFTCGQSERPINMDEGGEGTGRGRALIFVVSGLPYTLPDAVIDPLFDSLKQRTKERK